MNQSTVPCKVCGTSTPCTGTKMCNNCYEVVSRLRCDNGYAEKVLNYFSKTHRVRVLGERATDGVDYEILATSEMDARVIAFAIDGLPHVSTWVDKDTLELVKQYTEVLR